MQSSRRPSSAGEPRASWRRGRRSEHRRRRRDPAKIPTHSSARPSRESSCRQPGRYAIGVCYLPVDPEHRAALEQTIDATIEAEGQSVLWWRDVPVDERYVGDTARAAAPYIRQVLIAASDEIADQEAFERKLYVIRRLIERAGGRDLALPSFSSRTIVYKGMLTAPQLPRYFTDLRDPRVASAWRSCTRASRRTRSRAGRWRILPDDRPQRRGQHAAGNVNWMRARESQLASELFGDDLTR